MFSLIIVVIDITGDFIAKMNKLVVEGFLSFFFIFYLFKVCFYWPQWFPSCSCWAVLTIYDVENPKSGSMIFVMFRNG